MRQAGTESPAAAAPRVIDLGRVSYARGYELQVAHHEEVLAAREAGEGDGGDREWGRLLLVEHDPPVITVSRRPGSRGNLVASEALLRRLGVEVAETDRGGDITYHGPGQLVVYPILDLNRYGLRLHDYMRLLEAAVIDACAGFGVAAGRDACATGVWVGRGGLEGSCGRGTEEGGAAERLGRCGTPASPSAKICAMGVRIRRWVTMHGLALNVTTDLEHFGLIVPCGLAGRPVTSLERELGRERCPSMEEAKAAVCGAIAARLRGHLESAGEGPRPNADGRG